MTTNAVNQIDGSVPDPSSGADKICLVIMPFEEVFDPVMDAIRVGVDRAGVELRCRRLDDLSHPGAIVDDLTREITLAEVCIADLSGLNPNVMFEVGFAMSNKKPVILISQDIGSIPFDLSGYRAFQYDMATARQTLPERVTIALVETTRRLRARPAGVAGTSNPDLHRSENRAAGSTNSDMASSPAGDRPKAVRGGRGIRISLSILFSALLAMPGILWLGPLRMYKDRAAELEAQNREYSAEANKLTAERDKRMNDVAELRSQVRTLNDALLRRPTARDLGPQALKTWIVGQLKAGTWKGKFQYVDGTNTPPAQQNLEFSGSSSAPRVQLHTIGHSPAPEVSVDVDGNSIKFFLPTDTANVTNLYDLHFCLAGKVMQDTKLRGAVNFDNRQ